MATYQAQAEDETESLDDYLSSALGMTADNAKDYFTQTAEGLLQERIIIGAVAEKENITLSNEEFQKILEEHADEYGVGVDEFLAYYNQNGYSEEDVRMGELENKVLEYLAGVVKITEAEETEDDEAFIDWTEDTEAETETEE